MGLALGVVLQALGAAAAQRVVEDEVERQDVRQLEALHGTAADVPEMLLHPLGRHLLAEHRIDLRSLGDQADVGGVPFVARAGVGDLGQFDPHTGSLTVSGVRPALSDPASLRAGRAPAHPSRPAPTLGLLFISPPPEPSPPGPLSRPLPSPLTGRGGNTPNVLPFSLLSLWERR